MGRRRQQKHDPWIGETEGGRDGKRREGWAARGTAKGEGRNLTRALMSQDDTWQGQVSLCDIWPCQYCRPHLGLRGK